MTGNEDNFKPLKFLIEWPLQSHNSHLQVGWVPQFVDPSVPTIPRWKICSMWKVFFANLAKNLADRSQILTVNLEKMWSGDQVFSRFWSKIIVMKPPNKFFPRKNAPKLDKKNWKMLSTDHIFHFFCQIPQSQFSRSLAGELELGPGILKTGTGGAWVGARDLENWDWGSLSWRKGSWKLGLGEPELAPGVWKTGTGGAWVGAIDNDEIRIKKWLFWPTAAFQARWKCAKFCKLMQKNYPVNWFFFLIFFLFFLIGQKIKNKKEK